MNSYPISLVQVNYGDKFVAPNGKTIFSFILPTNSVCCVQKPAVDKVILYNSSTFNSNNQPNIAKHLWSDIT